jgi:hypothetical protein
LGAAETDTNVGQSERDRHLTTERPTFGDKETDIDVGPTGVNWINSIRACARAAESARAAPKKANGRDARFGKARGMIEAGGYPDDSIMRHCDLSKDELDGFKRELGAV